MTPTKQIKVLLADDNAGVRQSLRTSLSEGANIVVVGEARNGQEAVELVRKLRPNVVLMDVSMPLLNGLEATRQIVAARPSSKVIMLSAYDDDEYKRRAKAVGAVGFVAKQSFAETLTWAVNEVASGRTLYDPVPSEPQERRKAKPDSDMTAKTKRLNSRESNLLRLLAEGSPTKQIASQLCLSIAAVDRQLTALMNKLGLPSIANLAVYALASGAIESNVVLTIT